MPDLIPHHEPPTVGNDGEWTIWHYRSATVRSVKIHNILLMPGHPLDGTYIGHAASWWPLIDRWLDHGDLPPPYVWPQPPRKPVLSKSPLHSG